MVIGITDSWTRHYGCTRGGGDRSTEGQEWLPGGGDATVVRRKESARQGLFLAGGHWLVKGLEARSRSSLLLLEQEERRGSRSRRLGPADGGSCVLGQRVRISVHEDPLKSFKGPGDYTQIYILESFWRIHQKEKRLERGNQ